MRRRLKGLVQRQPGLGQHLLEHGKLLHHLAFGLGDLLIDLLLGQLGRFRRRRLIVRRRHQFQLRRRVSGGGRVFHVHLRLHAAAELELGDVLEISRPLERGPAVLLRGEGNVFPRRHARGIVHDLGGFLAGRLFQLVHVGGGVRAGACAGLAGTVFRPRRAA